MAEDRLERHGEDALDRAHASRLGLPAVEVGAVVGEGELERAHGESILGDVDDRIRIPYKPPEITGEDFKRAVAAHLKRIEEWNKTPEAIAEVTKAKDEARAAARMLKEKYGAKRVVLFGSLARGDCWKGFDVDLAVEGVERDFFGAWADVERLIDRKVDLIDLKNATPLLLKRLKQDGIELP
jgi:uncharacterized protein